MAGWPGQRGLGAFEFRGRQAYILLAPRAAVAGQGDVDENAESRAGAFGGLTPCFMSFRLISSIVASADGECRQALVGRFLDQRFFSLHFLEFHFFRDFSVKLVDSPFFLSHVFWQQVRQRISGLCWFSNSVPNFRDIFVLDSFEIPAAWTSTFSYP